MARLTVEQKALTDPRFRLLGRAILNGQGGTETVEQAVGLYYALRVWNYCQEHSSYVVPEGILDAISDHLSDALVNAKLGTRNRRGVRIHGTKGRVEWLEKAREHGKIRQKRFRDRNALVTQVSRTPPAPAPAPALIPDSSLPPNPPAGGLARSPSDRADDWQRRAPGTRTQRSPLANPERKAWLEEQFAKLYEFYPRHVGKDAAWRAFLKTDPDATTLRWIGRDIKRRTDAAEWLPLDEERARFIPHLATYLNQRRWTDTEETA